MRISDWSSDVCSSDLPSPCLTGKSGGFRRLAAVYVQCNITLPDFSPRKAHLALHRRLVIARRICLLARLSLIRDPSYPSNFRLLQVRVDDGNAHTGVFACLDGSSARRRRTLCVNNLSPATDTQTQAQHQAPTTASPDLAPADPLLPPPPAAN